MIIIIISYLYLYCVAEELKDLISSYDPSHKIISHVECVTCCDVMVGDSSPPITVGLMNNNVRSLPHQRTRVKVR